MFYEEHINFYNNRKQVLCFDINLAMLYSLDFGKQISSALSSKWLQRLSGLDNGNEKFGTGAMT